MDPKPNIHYIGVIENDGERVVYKKYPIELPRSLLDSLDSMQDNAEKTILDMQSEVERYYPPDERGRFLSDYLAPRYYRDTYSYYAASRKAELTKRLNADVKMFSTDTIGWTTYYNKISSDVSIRFDSNFGFGRRSYFQLGLIYRGIEIFPYSAYVRYYFANWRTLIAHTRSYELQRRSWDYALEFVVEHANAAATDPVRFVNEFILGEVKKMMDGLRGIVRMTPAQFHEEMNPQWRLGGAG